MSRQIIGLVVGVLMGTATMVAMAERAEAAAYPPGQQVPSQAVADFVSNPSQVLTQYPDGGGQMITRVRDLLASDPATLAAILGLLKNANIEQKSALASALAQAAKLYTRAEPAFALQIQQSVANTQDQPFILAYTAAAGDLPIGGVGGGAASGGGIGGATSSSGGLGGFSGAAQSIGGGGTDTGSFSLSGGTATGANGQGQGQGSTTNTTSTSVSP